MKKVLLGTIIGLMFCSISFASVNWEVKDTYVDANGDILVNVTMGEDNRVFRYEPYDGIDLEQKIKDDIDFLLNNEYIDKEVKELESIQAKKDKANVVVSKEKAKVKKLKSGI